MRTDKDIARIIKYFRGRDEVAALYLFGSYATRSRTRESDIDLAVLVDEKRLKRKNYDLLKKEYFLASPTFSLRPVDITLLNAAGPHLRHRILRTGSLLLDRDARLRRRFAAMTIIEYLDFKPIEEMFSKAVAGRFRRASVGR